MFQSVFEKVFKVRCFSCLGAISGCNRGFITYVQQRKFPLGIIRDNALERRAQNFIHSVITFLCHPAD